MPRRYVVEWRMVDGQPSPVFHTKKGVSYVKPSPDDMWSQTAAIKRFIAKNFTDTSILQIKSDDEDITPSGEIEIRLSRNHIRSLSYRIEALEGRMGEVESSMRRGGRISFG